jgi:hypothetical protein
MVTVHKSVRVDKALWEKARGKAVAEGKTMQDLVTELLTKYLGPKKAAKKGGK